MLTLLYCFVEFEKLHLGVFENMFEANDDSEFISLLSFEHIEVLS